MLKLRLATYFVLCFVSLHCLNVPEGITDKNFISDLTFQPYEVENNILNLIKNSRKSITISLYGFDHDKIADAIIEAKRDRGIEVKMSTEYDSEEYYASWRKIIQEGIPVRLGNNSGIMHNKYLIFDDQYVVTGSTNLTGGMFKHFNNTIILKSEELVQEYKKDFEVQYAGYYASAKVDGYREIFEGGADVKWQPETIQIGKMQITPYFTPYKEVIQPYEENILNAKAAYDTSDQSTACFVRISSGDACDIKRDPCEDIDYYDASSYPGTVYRYYNPDGNHGAGRDFCKKYDHALNLVVKELRQAKKSITLLIFAFTDRVIMQELIRAKRNRNVRVRVWMDRSQYRSSCRHSIRSFKALAESIDQFKITRRPNGGSLHHKVILIDNSSAILGSMNFSSNAVNNNDENFLLIKDAPNLVKGFRDEIAKIDRFSYNVLEQPEITRIRGSNIKEITHENERKAEVKRICSPQTLDSNEELDADQGGAGL